MDAAQAKRLSAEGKRRAEDDQRRMLDSLRSRLRAAHEEGSLWARQLEPALDSLIAKRANLGHHECEMEVRQHARRAEDGSLDHHHELEVKQRINSAGRQLRDRSKERGFMAIWYEAMIQDPEESLEVRGKLVVTW